MSLPSSVPPPRFLTTTSVLVHSLRSRSSVQRLPWERHYCKGTLPCLTHLHVQAVIGAGAAGLVAARELQAEGHTVRVLEQASGPGGVWVLDDATETEDPLGQNAARKTVHGSMYDSLRTNLPRELMGFRDFPFDPSMMLVRTCHQPAPRAYGLP